MEKRGQATILIALAIIIAAIIVLAFVLKPSSFLIGIKSYSSQAKENFEDCLKTKLSYELVSNNFISQPNLVVAKSYLEDYMNDAAYKCSEVFSQFKDVSITASDKSSIKSKITFDGSDFNEISAVNLEVYFPITIKKGSSEEQLSKFETGVSL